MTKEQSDRANEQSDRQNRCKRMLWRAQHRGMKEMDLMLGQFAEQKLAGMNDTQLEEFEAILEVSDAYLVDWITEKTETPAQFQTTMFAQIMAQSFVANDYKKL